MTLPKLCAVALLGATAFLASCAVDGFNDETWQTQVTNTLLSSPSEDEISITSTPDGARSIIKWKVIEGARGYSCQVYNTTTGEDILLLDSLVDGTGFTIPREEDSNYKLVIRTLANTSVGNTDAETATEKAFSSFISSFATIPSESDIAEYIAGVEWPEEPDEGIVFDLEAGGIYTLNSGADIGNRRVIFRCQNPANRPIISIGENGTFVIQSGITLKNLKFDATEMTARGLISYSKEPTENHLKNQDVFTDAAVKDFSLINKPIYIQGCMVKNLKRSLFSTNEADWAVVDLIVRNNIIQLNHNEGYPFLDFYKSKNNKTAVKNLTIEKNTIYNLQENSDNNAYFFRLANASNATGAFGTKNGTSSYKYDIVNNTIIRTFTGKDFGNNIIQNAKCVNTISYNIFYDVYRVNKFMHNNSEKHTVNNTMWYVVTTPQNDDTSKTDNDGNPYTILSDPGFTAPTEPLDLSQENGGLNLTPSGDALAWGSGDPRWLPESTEESVE